MKKLIALLVVLAFVVGVAGVYSSDAAVTKKAVKKVVKKPLKKAVKKAAPKAAPAPVAPAPPPPPVAPVAPPAPVAVKPAVSAGLFGMGINTSLSGLYVNTGKGQLGGTLGVVGNWVLDDFVGLGPMVGLSASAVKYTVGAGYVNGGGGIQGIPAYAGGIVNLPADMLGGLESYLSGGVNYMLYGNGKTTGKIGLDAGFGINADLGLGLGKTGFAVGYSIVRSKTRSSKGIAVSVSQPIVL